MTNWVKQITEAKTIEVEPFSTEKINIKENIGYYVIAKTINKVDRVPFALRVDADLHTEINKCRGSQNAVINVLIRFALQEIKDKNLTIFN